MSDSDYISACCKASVKPRMGKDLESDEDTLYYECTECNLPCDIRLANQPARRESVVPSRMRINKLHSAILEAIDNVTRESGEKLTYAEIIKTLARVTNDMVADVLEAERKQQDEDNDDG